MTSYSPAASAIVIDANIAIRAVLPMEGKAGILERFAAWHRENVQIFAPDILLPETVSVIRQGIYSKWITEEEGKAAVEDVFRLGSEVIPSDVGLCRSALEWASRLGQSKAYDGFYLAAAEQVGAALWTADERLHNRAQQLGVDWVHLIDEP